MLKKIQDELRRIYATGLTQREMAKRAGIDPSVVCHLLNDEPERIGRASLSTLLSLLPEMRISFANSPITIQGDNCTTRNTINGDAQETLRRVRRALLSAKGMCDKCRLAAITALLDMEEG